MRAWRRSHAKAHTAQSHAHAYEASSCWEGGATAASSHAKPTVHACSVLAHSCRAHHGCAVLCWQAGRRGIAAVQPGAWVAVVQRAVRGGGAGGGVGCRCSAGRQAGRQAGCSHSKACMAGWALAAMHACARGGARTLRRILLSHTHTHTRHHPVGREEPQQPAPMPSPQCMHAVFLHTAAAACVAAHSCWGHSQAKAHNAQSCTLVLGGANLQAGFLMACEQLLL